MTIAPGASRRRTPVSVTMNRYRSVGYFRLALLLLNGLRPESPEAAPARTAPFSCPQLWEAHQIREGHRLPTTWSDECISHNEKRPARWRPQWRARVDARQAQGTRASLDRARRLRGRRFSTSRPCPERERSTRRPAARECFATCRNDDFPDDPGLPTLRRQAREQILPDLLWERRRRRQPLRSRR